MASGHHDEADDGALVGATQAGDGAAFAELFRRHHPAVKRVCARRLGSTNEADEVAQAAFVRAYERIDQCRGERRFGGWVQVIALRLCADASRDRARNTKLGPTGDEDFIGPNDCEESLLRAEEVDTVRRALCAVPERQRDVLLARHVDGRRPGEIAASLAISIGAVESLLVRGRRRVAAAYQSMAVEQGAASTSLTTFTATMASAAVEPRPLRGFLRSVSRLVETAEFHVARAFGFGLAAVGERAAGLAVATALSLAPAVSGPAIHGSEPPTPLDLSSLPAVPAPGVALPADPLSPSALPSAPVPLASPSAAVPLAPSGRSPAADQVPSAPAAALAILMPTIAEGVGAGAEAAAAVQQGLAVDLGAATDKAASLLAAAGSLRLGDASSPTSQPDLAQLDEDKLPRL